MDKEKAISSQKINFLELEVKELKEKL